MPSHKQLKVEAVITERSMGRSASNDLASSYSKGPIALGELTDDTAQEQFQALVMDGEVNDQGHTFGKFDRDYVDAPDYGDVDLGKHNIPSPWVPNPVSPGPGSINPSDQGPPPDGFGQSPPDQWGSGVGSQLSPKTASEGISAQTLGDYKIGKSIG
jgi:hypothetical protein